MLEQHTIKTNGMLDNKSKGKADNVQCYEISALMKNGVVNLIAHL